MKRLLGALVALASLTPVAARSEPLVPTFTVGVPSPLTVLTTAHASHDLEVSYVFTQEDLVNARIELDLPPGVLVVSVGDNQPFTTHCTYQAALPQGPHLDWRCVLSSPQVMVGSGLTSRAIIRINPVAAFFPDNAPLTFRARLTADNLSQPVEATVNTVVSTSPLSLYEYPTLDDRGTTESIFVDGGGPVIGILSELSRGPQNGSTHFLGTNTEVRTTFAPGRENYFLADVRSSGWASNHVAWELATTLTATFPGLLGPIYVSPIVTTYGHRAELYRSYSGAGQFIWSACGDVVTGADVTPSFWAPVSATDPTLEAKLLGQNTTYTENMGDWSDFDCDAEIGQILQTNTITVGANVSFGPTIRLPMGAVPLYDLFAVLAVDTRVDYRSFFAHTSYTTNSRAPVDLYACTFPSGDVDVSRFLTEEGAACTFLQRSDDFSVWEQNIPAGTTHFVVYEPTYFIDEPFGRTVYRYFGLFAETTVPCALAGQTLVHRSRVQARLAPGGVWVDSGWATVEDEVQSESYFQDGGPRFHEDHQFYGNDIITTNRGATFSVMSNIYNVPLGHNPDAVYTLPPGIRLVRADWIDDGFYGYVDGNCVSPEMTVTEENNPDGSTTVRISLRAQGGGDWFYVSYCSVTDCAPAGRGDVRLQVYVDPNYPWRDGDFAEFVSHWDTLNNGSDGYPTQGGLTINVPDQLRLRIDPFCDGDGGGCDAGPEDGRRPGLRYTAENRSGRDLSDVIIEAYVPYVGDGAGTEVDATLYQIDNPAGLALTCFDESAQVVTCGPAARRVTAVAPAMAPLEDRSFGLVFEVDPGAQTGQRLYGRGSMRANELPEVPAAAVAPIRVNLCPGVLEALVYFDADGDGIRDADELALPNWAFTFTDSESVEATYEVASHGELVIALANGIYSWTAFRLESSAGAFSLGGNLAPLVVCADEVLRLEVPVTCECQTWSCQGATCDMNGACTYFDVPGPIPGVLDDTCDWVDDDCDGQYSEDFQPYTEACTNGACTGTRTVTCHPFNNTLQPGVCNAPTPQPEQCDGIDNDCDGLIDVADPSLVIPQCYDPYTGGPLRGVCVGAVVTVDMCVSWGFGSYWDSCYAREFLLAAYQKTNPSGGRGFWVDPYENGDTCDGLDNDCDGLTDEDFVSSPVSCGCGTTGTTTCENGILGTSCPPFDGGPEVCDGIDNDCDGLIDQADPDLVVPDCESEVGVCANRKKPLALCAGELGWLTCTAADYAYAAFPDYRADNDCDGLDNDCDGLADEHFPTHPVICENGCSPWGTVACVDGEVVDTCELGTGSPEICDGVDNDCDRLPDLADPDLVVPLCANQAGVCQGARTPLGRCTAAGWDACQPADYAAHAFPAYAVNDSVCDGLDNDCDGQTDEEYVGALQLCPPGSCQPVARDRCVSGGIVSGCEPTGPGCPTGPSAECEACTPVTALTLYGVARDQSGVPRGSFRCTRSPEGVLCDVDEAGYLAITDTLWCGP